LTAWGAINEARKLGLRVPEELSILGFDDTDIRFSVEPTMTAICQNSRDLGRQAFETLVRICDDGDGAGSAEPAKAWLEINHTTARAPSKPVRIMPNGERLPVTS
jgi:DNA-binding LacI/PurR family transcriptional regulator